MAEDTTTRAGNGERVRLVSQERLDIPDTNALQALVYDYVSQALGGILGPGSGLIVPPRFIYNSTTGVFTFSSGFQAWDAWESNYPSFPGYASSGRRYRGGLVEMDTAVSGQSTTIDLSGATSTFGLVIWGKRVEFDGDLDTRRKWDTTTQDEVAFSTETRTKHRVAFAYTELSGEPQTAGSINAPSGWPDEHWFPLFVSNANFTGSVSTANFRPVNAWDSFAEDHGEQAADQSSVTPSCVPIANLKGIQKALIDADTTLAAGSGRVASSSAFTNTYGGGENLIRQLWRMRNAIQRIVGYKSSTAWFDAPGYDGHGIAQKTVTDFAPADDATLHEGPETFGGNILGSFYSLRSMADEISAAAGGSYWAQSGMAVIIAFGSYTHTSGSTYTLVTGPNAADLNLPSTVTASGTGSLSIYPTATTGVGLLFARGNPDQGSAVHSMETNSTLLTNYVTVNLHDASGSAVDGGFNVTIYGVVD